MPGGEYEYVDLGEKSDSGAHRLSRCVILADCAKKICLQAGNHLSKELAEVIKKRRLKKKKEGEWIQGWGYDEEKFQEHQSP